MSANRSSNGRTHGANNRSNRNSNSGDRRPQQQFTQRLQIPGALDRQVHQRDPSIPTIRLALAQCGSISVAKVLVIAHPEGDVTISTAQFPRVQGGSAGFAELRQEHLGEGDRYEVVQITVSPSGAWFTPYSIRKLARKQGGGWKNVEEDGLNSKDTRRVLVAKVRCSEDAGHPGHGSSSFPLIRACPNMAHMRKLSEFTGLAFDLNTAIRYTDYKAMSLSEFLEFHQEEDDAFAQLRVALRETECEGAEALQTIAQVGAGYERDGQRVIILDAERVAKSNDLAIRIRAITMAPNDLIPAVEAVSPGLVQMADDLVQLEAMSPVEKVEVAAAAPTFAEMRALRRPVSSKPSFGETMRPIEERLRPENHEPARAELAVA